MEWAGHEVCMRDRVGSLYERQIGQGMKSVCEMEWAGHVVCMRDKK